jgi:hypothetical protein
MDVLDRGDVVLLTGRKHVMAIGEIGCVLRNHELARRLWLPDPSRCLWSNVFSFQAFQRTDIPYEEVWALPGFTVGDNFMGLRLLRPEKRRDDPERPGSSPCYWVNCPHWTCPASRRGW